MSKIYRIGEFAERIGKSPSTLRRWDNEGVLPAKRTPGAQRYYDESDVRKALGIEPPDEEKLTVVYCRVSSKKQADDLKSQVEAMRQFCLGAGIAVDEWIEEFGSGLNFKRKKFLSVIERIEAGKIKHLVIAHQDRLVRFGFDFFLGFAQRHGCPVTVVNQEQLSPAHAQEMVEDLMTIVHCFSSRLYGLRSYKIQIREAAEDG
ncbi:MAG: IS607 family transposase [Candidatus Bipolaricaulia bacterium]